MTDIALQDLDRLVVRSREESESSKSDGEQKTIIHTLLQSDLPPFEKSDFRISEEAQLIVGAGIETTAWTLCVATYYILADSDIHSRLRAELRKAIPDISAPDAFNYRMLESLPYLRACGQEAIRHSMGVSARNTRLLHEPLPYGDWTIPPLTAISMTTRDVHNDEAIYPEAKKYTPERWLEGAPKPTDGSSLDHYFVSFGKGPRMCLGIK